MPLLAMLNVGVVVNRQKATKASRALPRLPPSYAAATGFRWFFIRHDAATIIADVFHDFVMLSAINNTLILRLLMRSRHDATYAATPRRCHFRLRHAAISRYVVMMLLLRFISSLRLITPPQRYFQRMPIRDAMPLPLALLDALSVSDVDADAAMLPPRRYDIAASYFSPPYMPAITRRLRCCCLRFDYFAAPR